MTNNLDQRLMAAFLRFNRLHARRHIANGLRPYEFAILHHIYALSAEQGQSPMASALSERLAIRPPTLSQQVRELERKGLVRRMRDQGDRRVVRLALTPEGEIVLNNDIEEAEGLFREVSERLGDSRGEDLLALLTEATDVFAARVEARACENSSNT